MTTTATTKGWENTKLNNLVDYIVDNRGKNPSVFYDSGIPVIDNFMITGNKSVDLENAKRFIDEKTFQDFIRKYLKENDVLVTLVGNGFGNVALAPKEESVIIQNTIGIRCGKKCLNEFLYYYLLLNKYKITELDRGAAQPSVKVSDLLSIELSLPSVQIQEKIVDNLTSYDDLIENNTHRIKILEQIAQAIYTEWFSALDDKGAALDGVITIQRGKSYKGSELSDSEGVPFVNLKCIDRDGGFRKSGLKHFTGDYKDSYKVIAGDIVMAVTDMTQDRRIVARAARVPSLDGGFGVISMDLVKIEPREGVNLDYIYALLRWSGFADEVKNHANGANVLHLIPNRITDYKAAIAPKEKQKEFGDQVSPILDLIDKLELKNESLRESRGLLLPKLMTGEINV